MSRNMRTPFQMSVFALALVSLQASFSAVAFNGDNITADSTSIQADNDGSGGESLLLRAGTGITGITLTSVNGGDNTVSITGETSINTNQNNTTNINGGTSTGAVTIGNSANTTSINSATNNMGVNAFATANNIGTNSAAASTNLIGSTNTGTTVTSTAGNSSQALQNNSAVTRVTGGTTAFSGGSTTVGQLRIENTGGATVDANGLITATGGTAPSVALTLTNGLGNTHGLVVTENQTTISGGTQSSSMTLGDNGATFSNAATGAPVQVHGVDDGTADFDAVNVRQFAGAIASVTAMANIPQVDPGKTYAMGVGYGNYMSKDALALGGTYRLDESTVLKASLASNMHDSQETTVGLGAAWSW